MGEPRCPPNLCGTPVEPAQTFNRACFTRAVTETIGNYLSKQSYLGGYALPLSFNYEWALLPPVRKRWKFALALVANKGFEPLISEGLAHTLHL